MGKTVSVIIPAYNTENYIGRCLYSVCNQDYHNLQILVIDDGSTDNTLQVARKYESKDARVTVCHKDNGGVSSARNMAMDKADGDYFFFLDSDDELEDGAIKRLVDAMECADYDWVSCQYSGYDETGARLKDFSFVTGEIAFTCEEDRLSFLTEILLKYQVGFEVWDKLYRADVIRQGNIRFQENCRIGEDLAFNIRYLMCAKRLNCIGDRLIRYLKRSGSAMNGLNRLSDNIFEHSLVLKDLWNHLECNAIEPWIRRFPCIFVKVLDNTYIGHTPVEVSNAIRSIGDYSFIKEKYRDIADSKTAIINMYTPEIARVKYYYHIYVRQAIDSKYIFDKLFLFLYSIYRRLRRRAPLQYFRMPY